MTNPAYFDIDTEMKWYVDNPPKGHLSKTQYRPQKGKKINKLSVDGTFIRQYSCISVAASLNKISQTNIKSVLSGNSQTAGGYRWEVATYDKPNPTNKGQPPKKVEQYDSSGNLIATHDSVKSAATYIKRSPTSISKVLTGAQKTTGGFIFKYNFTQSI